VLPTIHVVVMSLSSSNRLQCLSDGDRYCGRCYASDSDYWDLAAS
jgi:hypothetical protein